MGRSERTVKWVKRNPVVTVATLAVALALALGATVSYLKYIDAQQQKGIAEVQKQEALKEADKAKKARDFLISIFRISETDILGGNVTAREIVADAEKRIPAEFADQPPVPNQPPFHSGLRNLFLAQVEQSLAHIGVDQARARRAVALQQGRYFGA